MDALTSNLPEGDNGDDSSDDSDSDAEAPSRNKRKGKEGTGVYVPPKLSAVHYDGDDSKTERMRKQAERARKRALKYEIDRLWNRITYEAILFKYSHSFIEIHLKRHFP